MPRINVFTDAAVRQFRELVKAERHPPLEADTSRAAAETDGPTVLLFRVPQDGIPARTETVISSAECVTLRIKREDGTLLEMPGTRRLWNTSGRDLVEGDELLGHRDAWGFWMAGESPALRVVSCDQTGGANGTPTTPPSYTYTITDIYTGEELGTGKSPAWTREAGSFIPAQIGLAYPLTEGGWGLLMCDEARLVEEFECEDAVIESVASHSGNYTITGDDETHHIYTGSGGHTFTLPTGVGNKLRRIKNAGSGSLTVARSASDTIFAATGGNTSISLAVGDAATLLLNGTVWSVL